MEYIKYREISNGIIYYKNVPKIYYYNESIKSNNNQYDLFEYSICRTTELNESDIYPNISEKIEAIKVINNFKLVAIFRRKE